MVESPSLNRSGALVVNAKDLVICPICRDFPTQPAFSRKCSCVARYCRVCLSTEASERGRCPLCRTGFSEEDIEDDGEMERRMERTVVKCENEGCDVVVPLEEYKRHLEECPHSVIQCKMAEFGCSWKGERGCRKEHKAKCAFYVIRPHLNLTARKFRDVAARLDELAAGTYGCLLSIEWDLLNVIHLFEALSLFLLHPQDAWGKKRGCWARSMSIYSLAYFFTGFPYVFLSLIMSGSGASGHLLSSLCVVLCLVLGFSFVRLQRIETMRDWAISLAAVATVGVVAAAQNIGFAAFLCTPYCLSQAGNVLLPAASKDLFLESVSAVAMSSILGTRLWVASGGHLLSMALFFGFCVMSFGVVRGASVVVSRRRLLLLCIGCVSGVFGAACMMYPWLVMPMGSVILAGMVQTGLSRLYSGSLQASPLISVLRMAFFYAVLVGYLVLVLQIRIPLALKVAV